VILQTRLPNRQNGTGAPGTGSLLGRGWLVMGELCPADGVSRGAAGRAPSRFSTKRAAKGRRSVLENALALAAALGLGSTKGRGFAPMGARSRWTVHNRSGRLAHWCKEAFAFCKSVAYTCCSPHGAWLSGGTGGLRRTKTRTAVDRYSHPGSRDTTPILRGFALQTSV